jgi:circadian clock protein KaiC
VEKLDAMLSGGPYRASTVLVSGTPGSGKSSLAMSFLDAACRRGERALAFAFEESPEQIVRNMKSIGLDLQPWIDQGLLRIVSKRVSSFGLERHLTEFHREVDRFDPQVVAVDPASSLVGAGYEVKAVLTRIVDDLKQRGITAVLTMLVHGVSFESAGTVSSIVDTWLYLTNHEQLGERNRGISVIKSRGMNHSAQIREFRLTDFGIDIREPYASDGELLMGTARLAREADDRKGQLVREAVEASKRRAAVHRRATLEAQIAALRETIAAEAEDSEITDQAYDAAERQLVTDRDALTSARGAEAGPDNGNGRAA